ncbi:MAG: class I SAM-dependent methyltransferase [Deltaproteobacteria bacterium]|nr:class I SAM-dependent methyltransferase [Deltaproteobacteria bacterium]
MVKMDNLSENNIKVQSDDTAKYNSLFRDPQHFIDRENFHLQFLTDLIDKNISVNENTAIMEVGFGDGERLKRISAHYSNAKIIGVEVRKNCVDDLASQGYDCRLVTEELFKVDEVLDVIYGYNILHHISIPYDYLQHLYSMLKPGGILVFPYEAYITCLWTYIITTIYGNWKYEMNVFKFSKGKLKKNCKKFAANFYVGYNGLLCLPGFPRLNKFYRFFRFHKLPFINELMLFVKKD